MDGHGELLVLGAESTVALSDKKHLGAAVGMEIGVPLAGILGFRDIAQPLGPAAGRRLRRPGKAVLVAAHRLVPPAAQFYKNQAAACSALIIDPAVPLCNL